MANPIHHRAQKLLVANPIHHRRAARIEHACGKAHSSPAVLAPLCTCGTPPGPDGSSGPHIHLVTLLVPSFIHRRQRRNVGEQSPAAPFLYSRRYPCRKSNIPCGKSHSSPACTTRVICTRRATTACAGRRRPVQSGFSLPCYVTRGLSSGLSSCTWRGADARGQVSDRVHPQMA